MNATAQAEKGLHESTTGYVTLIDSHCHLDMEPLKSELALILDEAAVAGVKGFVVPGVHPDGWPGIAAMASENHAIMPAFGIHPMHAGSVDDQDLDKLREYAVSGVAIGEIGLDPAYPVEMKIQEQLFREQIRIACDAGLPLLLHCRRAFQKLLGILREERASQVGGIAHSFSGSLETANELIALGFAISVSGSVTWSNAVKPLRIAREVPLHWLVLETDAPDMAPQRYKGCFNRPAWLTETALRVAEVRGILVEEVAGITSANVRRILNLGGPAA